MVDKSDFACKHCHGVGWNEIGEELAFCELWAEWRNVTLGDCVGNCESEEREEEAADGS